MAKKKNTTKSNGNSSRSDFSEMVLGPVQPVSDAYLAKLAQKLLEYANQEDSYKISTFISKELISLSDFYAWCERYEPLKKANEMAKRIIGDRREVLALKGEFNPTIVLQTMGMYDKEYKEHYEWKAKLRANDTDKSETKIVVIERFGNEEIKAKNVDVIESKDE